MTNNEIVARFYYRFYHHDDKQNEEFEKKYILFEMLAIS